MSARGYSTLSPPGNRTLIADEIFRSCNAHNFCDDGHYLIDGGISKRRRLWLIYQFNSLTGYDGQHNYTSVYALLTAVTDEQNTTDVFFGFDSKHHDTLSRLVFDNPESRLRRKVLKDTLWHAVHKLKIRGTGQVR